MDLKGPLKYTRKSVGVSANNYDSNLIMPYKQRLKKNYGVVVFQKNKKHSAKSVQIV